MGPRHRKKNKKNKSKPQATAPVATGGENRAEPAKTHPTASQALEKAGGPVEPLPPQEAVVNVPNRRSKAKRDALAGLLTGIFFALVIIVVELVVDSTVVGRDAELIGYTYTDRLLWLGRRFVDPEPIRVVILDIGDLRPEKVNGVNIEVTPRAKLLAIIREIMKYGPSAIGLDINFAPYGEEKFLTPADPQFFDDCLAASAKSKVPLFLGLNWNNSDEDPRSIEPLLNDDHYRELFAWIFLPYNTRRVPFDLKTDKGRLPSFSGGIARKPFENARQRFPRWFAEVVSESNIDGHDVGLFTVDYGRLSDLRQAREYTLSAVEPARIAENKRFFSGKLVLIGDATRSEDAFNVALEPRTVPGVYVHACAANTLATDPFYELTDLARLAIDLVIVVFALSLVTWLRWHYSDENAAPVNVPRAFRVIAMVCLLALWLVLIYLHVLWSDFVLAGVFIVYHNRIEHLFRQLWRAIRWIAATLYGLIVFKKPEQADGD